MSVFFLGFLTIALCCLYGHCSLSESIQHLSLTESIFEILGHTLPPLDMHSYDVNETPIIEACEIIQFLKQHGKFPNGRDISFMNFLNGLQETIFPHEMKINPALVFIAIRAIFDELFKVHGLDLKSLQFTYSTVEHCSRCGFRNNNIGTSYMFSLYPHNYPQISSIGRLFSEHHLARPCNSEICLGGDRARYGRNNPMSQLNSLISTTSFWLTSEPIFDEIPDGLGHLWQTPNQIFVEIPENHKHDLVIDEYLIGSSYRIAAILYEIRGSNGDTLYEATLFGNCFGKSTEVPYNPHHDFSTKTKRRPRLVVYRILEEVNQLVPEVVHESPSSNEPESSSIEELRSEEPNPPASEAINESPSSSEPSSHCPKQLKICRDPIFSFRLI
jgi:hypothetical protein